MSWLTWKNKNLRLMIGWLWIAAFTLAIYSNTFTVPFFFDDTGSATDNKNIEHLWPIWKCLVPEKLSTITGRPVVAFTFALNYAVSQHKVWSYHAFNAGLHLACALLLLLLLIRAFASNASPARIRPHARALALGITLVWAVHPLVSESVIYIVQRTELLVVFFYLFTIYCAAQAYEAPPECPGARRAWFVLGVVSCALGMASKEVMISAPLAVLVYDRLFLHGSWGKPLRDWRAFYISLAASSLVLFAILANSPRGDTVGFNVGIHWTHYLYTQAWVIALYIKLCFVPVPLSIVYDIALTRHLSDALLPGAAILIAIGLTVRGLFSGRAAAMAGAVFFMVLAPSSSFIPIVTEVVGERRMYLPLAMVLALVAGFAANAFAWASEKMPRLGPLTPAIAAASLTISVVFAWVTFERTKDYANTEVIWRDALVNTPGYPVSWNNLAAALLSNERVPEAAGCFLKASQLHSAIPEMYEQYLKPKALYGLCVGKMGDLEGSRKIAEEVLKIQPLEGNARLTLALYYLDKGKLDQALWQCERASESDNNAWAVRARILIRLGRYNEAAGSFNRAIELSHTSPMNLVIADEISSAGPDASKYAVTPLTRLVEFNPKKSSPHLALARALGDIGKLSECVEQFRIAISIEPENVLLWQNYSSALARLGRYPEVVQALEQVVSLTPNDASAHSRLGLALAHVGRKQDAIVEWKRALELNPNDADARANLGPVPGPAPAP